MKVRVRPPVVDRPTAAAAAASASGRSPRAPVAAPGDVRPPGERAAGGSGVE